MSEDLSLYDLLNLSIATPHRGAVNFGALHALLYAVLRHLDIREVKTRWREDTPPVYPDAPVGEIQRDTAGPEEEQRAAPGPAADGQARLRTRIQTCEEDVSKAMKLIQELNNQKDSLKEEVEELRLQRKVVDAQAQTVTAVEKCCHRVDAVEEAVRSLKDSFQKYPPPEVLSHYVTRDVVQSAQLSENENLHKDLVNSASTLSTQPLDNSSRPPAPSSQSMSGQISSLQEVTDTQPATEAPSAPSGSPQQISGQQEATEALRSIDTLKKKFNKLEDRVAALEEELIANKGSQEVLDSLMDELSQQRDLIDSLMSDREKMFMSQDTETSSEAEAEAEAADTDSKAFHELRQQMSNLRKSVQKLNEDVKKLKVKEALTEERIRDRHLQDQLDDLQSMLEEMMLSLTSQLFGSLQDEAGQDESDSQGVSGQSKTRSAFTTCTANIGRKLNRVFKHYEQLQDTELYKTTEELEEKKADKQMVEIEIVSFDSVTEQLNAMFHELLSKVTGQEQDWHKVIDKLSTEMECKLVDRFHCLSCDRPVVKYTPGPWKTGTNRYTSDVANCGRRGEQLQESHSVTCKQIECVQRRYYDRARDNTSNRTEQNQNQPGILHERVSELTDYSHLSVSRSCGGSHTVTSVSQRRTGLQSGKHHAQTEADGLTQSEEVDIVGLDGHIYKGRLNASATRSTETKLPTISTKDGMCKPKDKAKNSMSHKPSVSPEAGHAAPPHHAHSAKSTQCSRSASSLSGRDWPVSTLGCTSHSSFTQASATAESNMEARANEPVNL
ncbi:Glutamine-rich protein 2 [Nibea albiflora]|uniref:Glutamine-rich protein 2 n=1 Tax=Nibea albiflora TaxID=240163 RepID=A0ACB7EXR6_NIBAL|nr:Glutamine-rich protein 2 [Nibea albiflora]